MKNRMYLVTGAAGLLGSNITKQLIEAGEEVRALVLEGDPAVKHVPNQAEVIMYHWKDFLRLKTGKSLSSIVPVS